MGENVDWVQKPNGQMLYYSQQYNASVNFYATSGTTTTAGANAVQFAQVLAETLQGS